MTLTIELLLVLITVSATTVTSLRDRRQHHYSLHSQNNARCVNIPQNLSLCHNVGYTLMRLPNLLDHETLLEVSQQSSFWTPLVASRCNSNVKLFLCSLFTPVCLDQPVYPCRSLCESVKNSCEPRMIKYGFPWPDMLRCQQFPADNQLCISQVNFNENSGDSTYVGEPDEKTYMESTKFNNEHNIGFVGSFDPGTKKPDNRKYNKKHDSTRNGGRSNRTPSHKNGQKKKNVAAKETLKREEVVKTLEFICKADFVAQIEPTSIRDQEASMSRITSKKVAFFKTNYEVEQTAKEHPSDVGSAHHHRYYFYTPDILLVKLSRKSSHPAYGGESFANLASEEDINGLASILSPSKNAGGLSTSDIEDGGDNYKIHKNDQLLVAGNRTSSNGRSGRLILTLIMRHDKESRLIKRIVRMFKEGADFCKKVEALKDPVSGARKLEGFISLNDEGNHKEDKFLHGAKKRRKTHQKDETREKKNSKQRKNKQFSFSDNVDLPNRRGKDTNLGDNSKRKTTTLSTETTTAPKPTVTTSSLRRTRSSKASPVNRRKPTKDEEKAYKGAAEK